MSNKTPQAAKEVMAKHLHSEIWIPPSASKASRRPALKSTGSVRGYLVNPATNREIVYESTLERDLAYILIAQPGVEDIHEQPEAVNYVDSDGVNRRHTFDFLVRLHNGTRTAIAVKPVAKVESSGIVETVNRIRDQCPRAFADRFDVRTGEHITRNRAANARLILKSRRMRNDSAITEVRRIASTLVGTVRVCDLLAVSRNDGLGFMAVASLIGDGVLEHVGPGRISHNSAVRPGRKLTRTH